jgi:hypothetical protein
LLDTPLDPDVPELPLVPLLPLVPDEPEVPDAPLVVFETMPLASTVKKLVLLALDDKFKICNGCVDADELIIRLPVTVVDCKIAIIHYINIKQLG